MKKILLFLFIFPCFLWSQTLPTAKVNPMPNVPFEVEWLMQKRALHAAPGNYPVYPDQMTNGEGEIIIGWKIDKLDCTAGTCTVEAKISYIKYLFLPVLDYAEGQGSSIGPAGPGEELNKIMIVDSRYENERYPKWAILLEKMREIPLVIENGNGFEKWLTQINRQDKRRFQAIHAFLNVESLRLFFQHLATRLPLTNSRYRKLLVKRTEEGLSNHFVRPLVPIQQTTIRGKINHPVDTLIIAKFWQEGAMIRYWKDSIIHLDADGRFEIEIGISSPKMLNFHHGYQLIRLYVEPGDTISWETDANAWFDALSFSGRNDRENELFTRFFREMRHDTLYTSRDQQLMKRRQIDVYRNILVKQEKELAFVQTNCPVDNPAFCSYMDRYVRFWHAREMFETAARFYRERDLNVIPEIAHFIDDAEKYFYRLPPLGGIGFDLESFLHYKYTIVMGKSYRRDRTINGYFELSKLCLWGKAVATAADVKLFRNYGRTGLNPSAQLLYQHLQQYTKDPVQKAYFQDYLKEGLKTGNTVLVHRNLPRGEKAPPWSFLDWTGEAIESDQFRGRNLFLHIGRQERLEDAYRDMQQLRAHADHFPEVVHLIRTVDRFALEATVKDKIGHFVPLDSAEFEQLRNDYYVQNLGNHYYLINGQGNVVVSDFNLNTSVKRKSAYKRYLAVSPPTGTWNQEQWLFFLKGLGVGVIALGLVAAFLLGLRRQREEREKRKRRMLELELKGIRSQMNPHFIFNAMSSIQNLIRKEDKIGADRYLTQFARLMRQILKNSEEEFIPLSEEVQSLETYCSLEALRLPFDYVIQVDDEIDRENTYIPGMILQPVIENAILHGLAPKPDNRALFVDIRRQRQHLICTVSDNGIGFRKANEASSSSTDSIKKKSYGLQIIRSRLSLLIGNLSGENLEIIDRSVKDPQGTGTIVKLLIPTEQ